MFGETSAGGIITAEVDLPGSGRCLRITALDFYGFFSNLSIAFRFFTGRFFKAPSANAM